MLGDIAMVRHIARIVAITFLILVCMLFPFLPGRYDVLAVALSTMAQLIGTAGLLVVPIGVLWLFYEWRRLAAPRQTDTDFGYQFAIASIIASLLVAVVIAIGAVDDVGFSLGLVVLALWTLGAAKLLPKLKRLKNGEERAFNPAPLYLICIPIAAFLCWLTLIPIAIEWSRNHAIEKSAQLVSEIERYHNARGRYPASLAAQTSDYSPSIIGIEQYYYAPNGDDYNLYFVQPTSVFGTREIVIYNPRDEHLLPGHDSDILRWTPEQLRERRGHYAEYETSTSHWKYFWFD
jgi:hypothetical protein